MARHPGMAELAAAAGVSIATVDRILNGREPVRAVTAARVAEAALRIGHPAALQIAPAPALREVRFGVVLHKQGQDFYKAFAEALRDAVAAEPSVRGRLVLEFSTSQAPSEMAGLMRSMVGRCDVLAATAVMHPDITSAVEALRDRGLSVFALLSDFAPAARAGYLGLDNLKVGRTAGWMMTKATQGPGKLAIFVGGHRWNGHELRDLGFRGFLAEAAPDLEVLETLVNLETRKLTYEATLNLLARQPDLRGIYVAGGGMEGAIAALRDFGAGDAAGAKKPVALVVSALTQDSRRGLAEGQVTLVIDTPLEQLCRALTARMALASLSPRAERGKDLFLPPSLSIPQML